MRPSFLNQGCSYDLKERGGWNAVMSGTAGGGYYRMALQG